MINLNDLEFKKLDFSGLKTLISWAKNEGWNPGPYDTKAFWSADPDGFYGFFLNNILIAGGAIISYNNEFGFMGLFIVKPEFRDAGIGRELWYLRRNVLIDRLNKNATIGMDGVVAMQSFYKKGGFEIAYTEERYEKLGSHFKIHPNISAIGNSDFNDIANYDKQCFGFLRTTFLKSWLNLPESDTFQYKENGILKGFAVVRKATVGYKVGPLFANNASIAEEIYKACLNSVNGDLLYIDVPMINNEAVSIIKKYNAKYVFECARMYYGIPPKININKVFGVTTFELG